MTVLLLLLVFAAVNISVLVLRHDAVAHNHFRTPTAIPVIGVAVSLVLMTTKGPDIFLRAGILLVVGVALFFVNQALTGPRGPLDTEEMQVVEGAA